MAIGGFLKGLFGGGSAVEPKPAPSVTYKDYEITATPMPQGGQFLTAGIISKTFPEGVKQHKFIRADTHPTADAAASFAVQKGQQIVDEQGDRMFRDG